MLLEDQIRSNRRRSVLLFGAFFAIYALMGAAISFAVAGWRPELNLIVLVVYAVAAVLLVLFTLYAGDDVAATVAGGRRIESRGEAPELWDAVETMAIAAGIRMPRLYLSPDPSPNALAAGRSQDQALVVVTRGLLERLDKEELEGVAAHEIAHIRNLDVRVMTYAAVLAGSVALIAELLFHFDFLDLDGPWWFAVVRGVVYLLAILLAPLAALVVQLAVSRRREFLADATAADLTRYPQGLASALRRISASGVAPQRSLKTVTHMCIVAPEVVGGSTAGLFSSHPPLAERLARLDGLANSQLHEHRPRPRSGALQELLTPQVPSVPEPEKAR